MKHSLADFAPRNPWSQLLAKSLLVLSGVLCLNTWAQAAKVGEVTHMSGVLTVKREQGSKILYVKSIVEESDVLNTGDDTYARVKFIDNSEIVLRPNSQLKLEQYRFNKDAPQDNSQVMSLVKGGLRFLTGVIGKVNRDKVEMITNTATIGIRGTHYGALLCQNDCNGVPTPSGKPLVDGLHVDVSSGEVVLKNQVGELPVKAGQFGFVPALIEQPILVPPQQAPRVTMPTSISQNQGSGQHVGQNRENECGL